MNPYTRNCPSCNSVIEYSSKKTLRGGVKNNSRCPSCYLKGENNPMFGKSHTAAARQKIALGHIGRVRSAEDRKSQGLSMKKTLKRPEMRKKWSDVKLGNKNSFYGKRHTEGTKDLLRARCTPFIDGAGIPTDKGAPELLAHLKSFGVFDFQQNYYLKELGYFADGYCAVTHTWLEFDTKYHRRTSQSQRDTVRENKIIQHFINIGNPLSQFIRYDAVEDTYSFVYCDYPSWVRHFSPFLCN